MRPLGVFANRSDSQIRRSRGRCRGCRRCTGRRQRRSPCFWGAIRVRCDAGSPGSTPAKRVACPVGRALDAYRADRRLPERLGPWAVRRIW